MPIRTEAFFSTFFSALSHFPTKTSQLLLKKYTTSSQRLHNRMRQQTATMDTYHVSNAIMTKPPRLSLKKRTLPLTKAVCKQPIKAPRPITPDLFIPILSTIEVSTSSEIDLAKEPSVESNLEASPLRLISYNNECDRDFCSSSATNTTPSKKQRRTTLSSKGIFPTSSPPILSFPKPKIKPKNYHIFKSIVMIDGSIDLLDKTGYAAPPEGKKVLQTTGRVPAAISLTTPMLSPPPMGTPIDPMSVIRRQFSESVLIDNFGRKEKKTTPARVSLSEPLIIPSIDELLEDYSTPPPIAKPALLPQFRMRRSIKRCLEF